ncbi:MAG: ankyrin repeat domain-containing protein [Pseudomonadota bacterium]
MATTAPLTLLSTKNRAKALLKAVHNGDPEALRRIAPYFASAGDLTLQQAQLVIAREHGHASWAALKREVSAGDVEARFLELTTLVYDPLPDAGPDRFRAAADLLAAHPKLAGQSVHVAAAIGDAVGVARMVAADPALRDAPGGPRGWPPLLYAAYSRLPSRSSWPAAEVLLVRGADPNAHFWWEGQCKFTALAGVFGHGELGPVKQPEHPHCAVFARALLAAGADPNDRQAAYNRQFEPENEWLSLLLEFGLAPSHPNRWPENPSGLDVGTLDYQLIQAIQYGYAARVRLLIQAGGNVNGTDLFANRRTSGRSLYQAALLVGHPEIAETLAAAGAVRAPLTGEDAFAAACLNADREAAAEALRREPDLLARVSQATLLSDAVSQGRADALELMLELGFDPNADGMRLPLHEAAYRGDVPAMRRLLAAGADPTRRDRRFFGQPIGFAAFARQAEAIAVLEALPMDIFAAAEWGKIDQLERSLAEDPDQLNRSVGAFRGDGEERADDWMTPLALAVKNDRREAVAWLLSQGARVDVGPLRALARAHAGSAVQTLLAEARP